MKYLVVSNNELNDFLQRRGILPIHSNSEKAIYVKDEETSKGVNGWHWITNNHSKYSGHYDLNTEREL